MDCLESLLLGELICAISNTILMPLWLFYDLVSVLSRALVIVLTLGFKILSRMIAKAGNLHDLIDSIGSGPQNHPDATTEKPALDLIR